MPKRGHFHNSRGGAMLPGIFIVMKIKEIVVDAGTQTRFALNPEIVAEYAEAMKRGDKFPPVIVFGNILADGFHRVAAAKQAGLKDIAADVRKGTKTDALKFALKANVDHGARLTNADKRHKVEIALRELPNLSD